MRVRKREEAAHSDIAADNGYEIKLVVGRCAGPCICRSTTVQLCSAADVPVWARRPHIIQGYRPNLSLRQCVASLLRCHNETGNIWTHLGGALVVACLGLSDLLGDEPSSPRPFAAKLLANEALVRRIFLFAAVACLGASAVYHAGNCTHSEACCAALLRADSSGIAILIAASFLPGVYFGFACYPALRATYLAVVAMLLLLGLAVSFADCFEDTLPTDSAPGCESSVESIDVEAPRPSLTQPPLPPKALLTSRIRRAVIQQMRVVTFACFVAIGVAVALHWCFLVSAQARSRYLSRVGSMLGSYALGFVFYASQYPERRWPGRFDFWLHSHQLWHVCVVVAVIIWWNTCNSLVEELGQSGCGGFVRHSTQGNTSENWVGLRASSVRI